VALEHRHTRYIKIVKLISNALLAQERQLLHVHTEWHQNHNKVELVDTNKMIGDVEEIEKHFRQHLTHQTHCASRVTRHARAQNKCDNDAYTRLHGTRILLLTIGFTHAHSIRLNKRVQA